MRLFLLQVATSVAEVDRREMGLLLLDLFQKYLADLHSKATQRNGPLPSQNSGLIYAGTKPGKSNAFTTPACSAPAQIVTIVKHDGAHIL